MCETWRDYVQGPRSESTTRRAHRDIGQQSQYPKYLLRTRRAYLQYLLSESIKERAYGDSAQERQQSGYLLQSRREYLQYLLSEQEAELGTINDHATTAKQTGPVDIGLGISGIIAAGTSVEVLPANETSATGNWRDQSIPALVKPTQDDNILFPNQHPAALEEDTTPTASGLSNMRDPDTRSRLHDVEHGRRDPDERSMKVPRRRPLPSSAGESDLSQAAKKAQASCSRVRQPPAAWIAIQREKHGHVWTWMDDHPRTSVAGEESDAIPWLGTTVKAQDEEFHNVSGVNDDAEGHNLVPLWLQRQYGRETSPSQRPLTELREDNDLSDVVDPSKACAPDSKGKQPIRPGTAAARVRREELRTVYWDAPTTSVSSPLQRLQERVDARRLRANHAGTSCSQSKEDAVNVMTPLHLSSMPGSLAEQADAGVGWPLHDRLAIPPSDLIPSNLDNLEDMVPAFTKGTNRGLVITATHSSSSSSSSSPQDTPLSSPTSEAAQLNADCNDSIMPIHTCLICLEELSASSFPFIVTESCAHSLDVCTSCLSQSIDSQVDSVFWDQLKCPICSIQLGYDAMRAHASAMTFER